MEVDRLICGDCLVDMGDIDDRSADMILCDLPLTCMNEKKIVSMYINERYTLRHLAEICNTDHHRIRRILEKNNVTITRRNTLKEFTPEHRRKIGESSKGRPCFWKGKKMNRESVLKNMANHLKYDVPFEWLDQFEDIEKLKFLNHSIARERDYAGFTSELYKQFIEKFYYDKQFNDIYSRWLDNKNDKYLKPSLDHINPKSKGGVLTDLNNLQFLSWFENRCKNDLDMDAWNQIKANMERYLL